MNSEQKLDLIFKIESYLAKIVPFYLGYLTITPNSIFKFIIYLIVVFLIFIIGEILINTIKDFK